VSDLFAIFSVTLSEFRKSFEYDSEEEGEDALEELDGREVA